MHIGSEVAIHARGAHGRVGRIVGAGRVLHPRVIQVLPPLDAELSRVARRADEFVVVESQRNHQVSRIRPGLVSYAEAAEILAREIPEVELAPTRTGLVAFETGDDLFTSPEANFDSPWWCRVVCLDSCSSC
jgi:hypothetical protein